LNRATLLLALAPCIAAADSPDLKGLRIGMTEAELTAAVPTLRCRVPTKPLADRVCTDTKNTVVGNPASILVSLIADKTVRINIYFNGRHIEEVRRAVVEKFGEPAATATMPYRSASGIESKRNHSVWNFADQQLQLNHVEGGLVDSWLLLTDKAAMNELIEKLKQDEQRKRRDL
jgi:hypothetical protein